jgi:RHS repeat-associated protein
LNSTQIRRRRIKASARCSGASARCGDGYYDGTVTLQGVRAFDPNMNQWTTPDAYSGDVHDPMSQHPYMWNSNNPVQYSDPSGYVVDLNLIQDVAPDLGQKVTNAVVSAVGTAVKGFKDFSDGLRSVIENDLPDPGSAGPGTVGNPSESSGGPGAGKRFSPSTRAQAAEVAGKRCVYCGRETVSGGRGEMRSRPTTEYRSRRVVTIHWATRTTLAETVIFKKGPSQHSRK